VVATTRRKSSGGSATSDVGSAAYPAARVGSPVNIEMSAANVPGLHWVKYRSPSGAWSMTSIAPLWTT
jgi:hypothetical protein